jgi:hypothetical protein
MTKKVAAKGKKPPRKSPSSQSKKKTNIVERKTKPRRKKSSTVLEKMLEIIKPSPVRGFRKPSQYKEAARKAITARWSQKSKSK